MLLCSITTAVWVWWAFGAARAGTEMPWCNYRARCQPWAVRWFEMTDVGLHSDRWVTELCCMQGYSDFSLLPDCPALQPGWGIFQEVRCRGDDEGHVRKPISLYWLQRKPPVIRLDIDIKFLDGSLSHFNSLEDCSSLLKICT